VGRSWPAKALPGHFPPERLFRQKSERPLCRSWKLFPTCSSGQIDLHSYLITVDANVGVVLLNWRVDDDTGCDDKAPDPVGCSPVEIFFDGCVAVFHCYSAISSDILLGKGISRRITSTTVMLWLPISRNRSSRGIQTLQPGSTRERIPSEHRSRPIQPSHYNSTRGMSQFT
jgi:hypothetical protein